MSRMTGSMPVDRMASPSRSRRTPARTWNRAAGRFQDEFLAIVADLVRIVADLVRMVADEGATT